MSGRHRVVRPRRRSVLAQVRVPGRALARWVRAGRGGVARVWARLVERARTRFDAEDPWAGVHLDPQATSPDPIPAPPVEEEPEPAPLVLTPEQVLPVLHTQHPHLPVAHVLWHVSDAGVSGEVNALEASAGGRRQIVEMFAEALAAPVAEQPDGDVLTVYATTEVGTVPVTVAAVLVTEETVPLGVYEETTQDPTLQDDAQATQALPPELVEAVMSR